MKIMKKILTFHLAIVLRTQSTLWKSPPPVNWVGGLEKGLSKHIKNECPYPPIIINHANIGN